MIYKKVQDFYDYEEVNVEDKIGEARKAVNDFKKL